MADEGSAHEVFLDFIEETLRTEREMKLSYHRRGEFLAVSSGVVAALLVALAVAVPTRSMWVVGLLLGTVAALVISGAFGLLVVRPMDSVVADVASLDRLRNDHWTDEAVKARKAVADLHTRTIAALRKGNKAKSRLLDFGQVVQLAAIAGAAACALVWAWPR